MQRYRLQVVLGFLIASSNVVFGSSASAPTPAFTITANNVTMSSSGSSGSGSSSFTLTSVNGYAGTVEVGCVPPTPPAGVNVSICNFGGPVRPPYTLTANQVVTGTIGFLNSNPCNGCLAPGLALAGVLLLGFGIRRRVARWLTLTLLVAGTLAGLAGISACGGNSGGATPGTYTYTITATDINTQMSQTASINVTVP
jgi:hypothetical protein